MLFRAHNTFINTGRLPTVDISFVKKKNLRENFEKLYRSQEMTAKGGEREKKYPCHLEQ